MIKDNQKIIKKKVRKDQLQLELNIQSYYMCYKYDTYNHLLNFYFMVQNQFNTYAKQVRFENDYEFTFYLLQ